MQDTIIQLKALGQMPDSLTGNPAGELVSKYDELLIKVKTPLTEEEVEALIGIFPESTDVYKRQVNSRCRILLIYLDSNTCS